MGKKRPQSPPCLHRGEAVKVGPYTVYAGGMQYFQPGDSAGFDLLIPLTSSRMPFDFGHRYEILAAPLVDYGGVPPEWGNFLEMVVTELKSGAIILAFCEGSHGRTGCFLGSLIALLESKEETPDPIAAARARHCHHAVETLAQAEAIFAIRGETLPAHYVEEFTPRLQP